MAVPHPEKQFYQRLPEEGKEPSKVDYQKLETYYNSEDVDRQITPDLRVESLATWLAMISNALNALDVDFKTVIILCDLEGFKYEEMARY